MARKINKQYCNGCVYSCWRMGVAPEISARIGEDPHPRPEHRCIKLDVRRECSCYKIERLPECVERRLADHKGAR